MSTQPKRNGSFFECEFCVPPNISARLNCNRMMEYIEYIASNTAIFVVLFRLILQKMCLFWVGVCRLGLVWCISTHEHTELSCHTKYIVCAICGHHIANVQCLFACFRMSCNGAIIYVRRRVHADRGVWVKYCVIPDSATIVSVLLISH